MPTKTKATIDATSPMDVFMWQLARVKEYAKLEKRGVSGKAAIAQANAHAVARVERIKSGKA